MLVSYLENFAKDLANKITPPPQRYFTYFFIIVGILWLGGGSYYYCIDEYLKFRGAIITGLAFFFLSCATALWEYYILKEKEDNKASNVALSIEDIVVKTIPFVLPIFFNTLKKIPVRLPSFKTLAITGIIGMIIYYKLRDKDNKL